MKTTHHERDELADVKQRISRSMIAGDLKLALYTGAFYFVFSILAACQATRMFIEGDTFNAWIAFSVTVLLGGLSLVTHVLLYKTAKDLL